MKIIIAITGASGSIYAKRLLEKIQSLKNQPEDVSLIFSENAKDIWEYEIGNDSWKNLPFKLYDNHDMHAAFSSGSGDYDCMIICPASMGTIGRIAHGTSENLICRAADVMLKERRKLIVVPRESPYNLIQQRNMLNITEAGGIICPACPSFYSKPGSIDQLVDTIVERLLSLAGFVFNPKRWNPKDEC
jgi:4-hydroxy-3-polyprenylbenzoate decarboxylase